MIVYFAHSIRIYGTPEAERARRAIFELIPECQMLDPERLDWKALEEKSIAQGFGKLGVYRAVIRQQIITVNKGDWKLRYGKVIA